MDAYIGKSLNCQVVEEEPFCAITEARFNEALAAIDRVGFLVDTNFPAGDMNRRNLELVGQLSPAVCVCISLCPERELAGRYGKRADGVIGCEA